MAPMIPAKKARMRDLEAEQKQIRTELARLLDDIEDHARRLPDEAQLRELRETAQSFATAVRASGATEAMTDAEAALAAFAGTRAVRVKQEGRRYPREVPGPVHGRRGDVRGVRRLLEVSAGPGRQSRQLDRANARGRRVPLAATDRQARVRNGRGHRRWLSAPDRIT